MRVVICENADWGRRAASAGVLQTRRDVYGRDKEVLALLQGSERRVADIPIARNYTSSSKPVMAALPSRPASRSSSVAYQSGNVAYQPRPQFARDYNAGWGWFPPQ